MASTSNMCPNVRTALFLLDHGAKNDIDPKFDLDALFYAVDSYANIFSKVSFGTDYTNQRGNCLGRFDYTCGSLDRTSSLGVSTKNRVLEEGLEWPLNFLH